MDIDETKKQHDLTNLTDYFNKYDGDISTHHFKYRCVKLLKAVQESFPNWIILDNKFIIDQTKLPIHECDMKLHSSYSIEQYQKGAFAQLLASKSRVIIIRDSKQEY